jgi:hypothetical protein
MQKSSSQSRPLRWRIVIFQSDAELRGSSVRNNGTLGYGLVTLKRTVKFKRMNDSGSFCLDVSDVNLSYWNGMLLAELLMKLLVMYI